MDGSQLSIVATSLSVAKDIAKAMTGIRDFNLIAEKTATLNEALLKMQEGLLAHNAGLFELQNKYFEACEETRKLKETLAERNRYTLVCFPSGHFAYRVNITPEQSRTSEPTGAEPLHYICQQCFDNGRKVVLQRNYFMDTPGHLECRSCNGQVID